MNALRTLCLLAAPFVCVAAAVAQSPAAPAGRPAAAHHRLIAMRHVGAHTTHAVAPRAAAHTTPAQRSEHRRAVHFRH